MSKRIGELLAGKFESRPARLVARVTSVPTDATGKPLPYVSVEVGGQTGIKAYTLPGVTLYPGDNVLIEGRGGAATTRYTVAGYQAGTRPDSGSFEIVADTDIGGQSYEPGDLIWGNPYGPHFHFDYSAGQLLGKTGTTIGLVLDAAGSIRIGNPAGVHQLQTPTGIEWRNGEAVIAALDGAARTIYGFERLGRPHGPCIEWGEVTDEAGQARYALRMLGSNGVPGFSVVTGSQAEPDDYEIQLGTDGSTNRVIVKDTYIKTDGSLWMRGDSGWIYDGSGNWGYITKNGLHWYYDEPTIYTGPGGILYGSQAIFAAHKMGAGVEASLSPLTSSVFVRALAPNGNGAITIGAWNMTTSDRTEILLTGSSTTSSNAISFKVNGSQKAYIDSTGLHISSPAHVAWVTGADAVQTSSQNQAARPSPNGYTEGPYVDTTYMLFKVPLPYKWNGERVVINKISFYGYTSANDYYFDSIALRRSDLDGTYTDDISYTTDIGNGSSGDTGEVVIYNSALTLADYPYMFVIKCAGGGSYANYRVYGLRIEWTTTV